MVGNRVFGHALILCVASALIFAPWGTTTVEPLRPVAEPAVQPIWIQATQGVEAAIVDGTDRQELVFGWQGAIALGKVRIAYWAVCLCLMGGALTSLLNFLRWTRLPSVIMFACFGFTAACSLVAIIQHALLGTVGTGSVLAIICALVGLALSPADEVHEPLELQLIEEPVRQFRSAA